MRKLLIVSPEGRNRYSIRYSYMKTIHPFTRIASPSGGIVGGFLLLLLLLTGCRKDLCYNHDEHAFSVKTLVQADWEREWERTYRIDWSDRWQEEWSRTYEEFCPDQGGGIRSLVYTEEGGVSQGNLPAEGGRLAMPEGTHTLLFYNNDTEYIVFDDMTSLPSATATTRTRTRAGFAELHAGERTITPPDMLYGAFVREFTAEKTLENVELPIEMRPLSYSYLIRYRFASGQQYVAQARGALAGVAERVYMRDGHTDGTTATLLFDCKVDELGCTALLQSFGAPDYSYTDGYTADATTHSYTLSLEVQLLNGKLLTYTFDVSRLMQAQPRGGVIQVTDIVVSDEDGLEGSGGFEVDVDDWGDQIDIPLPLE